MPNLSGSGGRSTNVGYATSYWFGRMYPFLRTAPNIRRGAAVLSLTYQANTGASSGSLKRVAKRVTIY